MKLAEVFLHLLTFKGFKLNLIHVCSPLFGLS